MENEIWKDIPGYEGHYMASNLGKIKSIKFIKKTGSRKNIILKPFVTKKGYLRCILTKNGLSKKHLVHRLVLKSFIGDSEKQVDHIDMCKKNNELSNLEYVTNRENQTRYKRSIRNHLTGATFIKSSKKWIAQININNKNVRLGIYDCEIDAHNAYMEKLKEVVS